MYVWPGVAATWGALIAGLASAITYVRVERGRRDLLPLARITYTAFTTPYRNDTSSGRGLVGVILHADVSGGTIGSFSTLARGATGDPRGSAQNDLQAEFLGDYVYTAATSTGAVGVWNDTRNAADCPAVDAWRESLRTGTSVATPAPQADCPSTFGNSDIYGAAVSDPTP